MDNYTEYVVTSQRMEGGTLYVNAAPAPTQHQLEALYEYFRRGGPNIFRDGKYLEVTLKPL